MEVTEMIFEWDPDKNQRNIEKHGLSFEDASRIFENYTFSVTDIRFDYGEVREISIGMIDGLAVVTVVHTDRDGICRLISARPASKLERKRYGQALQESFDS